MNEKNVKQLERKRIAEEVRNLQILHSEEAIVDDILFIIEKK